MKNQQKLLAARWWLAIIFLATREYFTRYHGIAWRRRIFLLDDTWQITLATRWTNFAVLIQLLEEHVCFGTMHLDDSYFLFQFCVQRTRQ